MKKAIFLDRDGTINIDYSHVFQVDKIQILGGVGDSIGGLKKQGYLVFIVSNQSCIGRGYAKLEEVEACMAKVSALLQTENKLAIIDEAYFAPDHPDSPTERRKPNPGMLIEAIDKYNLDPSKCWMIGDKMSDPIAGLNAGLDPRKCILLEPNGVAGTTTQDEIEESKKLGFTFYRDLSEATAAILKD